MITVDDILKEDERRQRLMWPVFDPLTGEGSPCERVKLTLNGYPINVQYVPVDMMQEPFVKAVKSAGGIEEYAKKKGIDDHLEMLHRIFIKIRCKYDFPYWAAMFATIKNKAGGKDIRFRLNRPQRRLVEKLEKMRKKGVQISIIILKARQWGGSTLVQMYMAWIQLVHKEGWNSTIASHTNSVSATVRGMYTKMLDNYPMWMLYPIGAEYDEREDKIVSFEGQQSIKFVPSRGCKIRMATANAQENLRSEDVAMVHCTEVALWPDTKELHPQDFVDACMSGMNDGADSFVALESTAKGSGNFFHVEFLDAVNSISGSDWIFVGWQEVERDQRKFDSEDDKRAFAQWLLDNRYQQEAPDRRSESGEYLWRQWEQTDPTLEGMNWYVHERKKKTSHDHMASESPSNWREAFSATGEELFDEEKVELMRATCKQAKWVGEVQGENNRGEGMMRRVRFCEDKKGELSVWQKPETFDDVRITNRYLVVVDIGGTSHGADWSVICVFDRYWMMEGGKPSVVAQWYGHIDHDILAFKAAQIARLYDNALLVVESNSLDKDRDVNADVSEFILNRVKRVYENLYERERSEEDIKNERPVKYGWHTNRATKPKIIKQLQEAVRDGLYIERDERCLDEMLVYEHNGQKYEAKQGFHDDLLMTRAIGLWVCFNEMDDVREVGNKEKMNGVYNSESAIL